MALNDKDMTKLWRETRVIACVGASANPARPSHYVSLFLKERGYRVIPVNPGLAGQEMWGEVVAGSLAEIDPESAVDMVDIFRRPEHVHGVVDAAIAALPQLRTVWMQLGISNPEVAATAGAQGLQVVQNRCPKIEIPRLFGSASPLGGPA